MARTRAHDFVDKQRAILDSAARVFADLGMDKASMSQIAAQAGVSKALLYHYYPGKDALIYAIISTHLQDLDAAIAGADDPALDPPVRLRRLIGAVVDVYRGADDRHKLQMNVIGTLPDEAQAEIHDIERRIVRRFAPVLAAINPGLDTAERPLLTPITMSLFGMMNWMYMWFRDDGALSRADYADLATALVLGGVGAVR